MNENKQNASSHAYHKQVELEQAIELGEKLKKINLEMNIKLGTNGKAFGSITNKEVSEKLAELSFDIEKKKIIIKEGSIKSEGNFQLTAKLHPKVEVMFNLTVKGIN